MSVLFRLIFCTLLIFGGNMSSVQGTVYSSPNTALKFSQCLIEKMSESGLFSDEDRNNMMEVANVMAEGMLNQYQTKFPVRVLLTAFITSMSDVIAHEDIIKNTDRRSFFVAALEQCSLSTTGEVDVEFIDVALKILSSIEQIKLSEFHAIGSKFETADSRDRNVNPAEPKVFNPPFVVQPSSVQIPYIPENFDPNGKTNFETQKFVPQLSYPIASEQIAFNPFAVQPSSIQIPHIPGNFDPNGKTVFETQKFAPEPSYPIASEQVAFNPLAVQPSPVQNPHISGYLGLSDKTVFETDKLVPGSYPIALKPDSITNTQFQFQSASNAEISSTIDIKTSPQKETASVVASFPESFQVSGGEFIGKIPQVNSDFGGLNIPQTKESSVVVISPAVNEKPVQTDPLQQPPVQTAISPAVNEKPVQYDSPQQPPVEGGGIIFQPPSMDSEPLSQSDTASKISPTSFPQEGQQDQIAPSSPSIETTVFNILIESETFRNTFNFGIPEETAINLVRSVTEKCLVGYDSDVVNDILAEVTGEVAKVSFRTPENYALAFSNALVRVLKLDNLPLSNSAFQIATSFLSNLEETKEFSPQSDFSVPEEIPSYDIVYPVRDEKQVDFDFESPPLAPEDTEGEIFTNVLAQYLSQSSELSNFFCSTDAPENRMKIYFTVIRSSLGAYGIHVSSIAATIASGVLAELSKEGLCSSYAQTISEVIAQVLDENRVLEGANAEIISRQMEFSLSQLSINLEPEQSESTTVNSPAKESETFERVPTLQPSFASNFDDLNTTSSAPPILIQVSSVSAQEVNVNLYPVTTPYTPKITDAELTSAASLGEIVANITEVYPTESPLDWESDGVIDQEDLASYLFEELKTVFDAYDGKDDEELKTVFDGYYDKDDELEESKDSDAKNSTAKDLDSADTAAVDSIDKISVTRDSSSKDSTDSDSPTKDSAAGDSAAGDSAAGDSAEGDSPTKNPDQPDTLTSSSLQNQKNVQNGNTEQKSTSAVISERKDVAPDAPSETHVRRSTKCRDSKKKKDALSAPENSSVKKELVELQPSFQDPQSTGYSTSTVLSPKSEAAFHDNAQDELLTAVASSISEIATSSIGYIRTGNFDIGRLCARINEFAPIVNIPPLDYCEEIAAVDYLLNVLRSTVEILKGV